MLRLTGMDLKLEQYKKGERFVPRHRRRPRGEPALDRTCGTAPSRCPATAEIDDARALDRARARRRAPRVSAA